MTEVDRAGAGRVAALRKRALATEAFRLAFAAALAGLLILWARFFLPSHLVPPALKIELGIIAATTLVHPTAGLLITTAAVPFSQVAVLWWNAPQMRWADFTVLVFGVAWLLRIALVSRQRHAGAALPHRAVVFFAAVVAAACVVEILRLARLDGVPVLQRAWVFAIHDFAYVGPRTGGLPDGVSLLAGLLLFSSVLSIAREDGTLVRRLIVTMVISAVGAAAFSILLARGVGFAELVVQARRLSMVRVAGHVFDVNAAGSYFAMVACLAIGSAAASKGRERLVWGIACGVLTYALWLSGSRIALASALAMVGLGVAQLRSSQLGRVISVRTGLAALAGALLVFTALLWSRLPVGRPMDIRVQFLETAWRTIEVRPLFGVGIGQFYPLSRRFMTPELGWQYSFENAHNYFLQIGAELGLVGLAAFIWLLVAVARRVAVRELWKEPAVLGVIGGLGAFLLTSLTGHPFLVREVVYPFWVTLGLAVAMADQVRSRTPASAAGASPLPLKAARIRRVALWAAIGALLVSVPFRVDPLARRTVVSGVFDWENTPDGRRIRWTRQYATIVVRTEVGVIELPMRAPRPVGVDIAVDGEEKERVRLSDEWTIVRVPLPPVASDAQYRRIDFRVDRTWALSEIFPASSDSRQVGIQLGEVALSPAP